MRLGEAPGRVPCSLAADLTFIGCPAARTAGGSASCPAPRPPLSAADASAPRRDRGPFVSAPPRAASHSETGAAGSGSAVAEGQSGFPGGRGLAGAQARGGLSPSPCREPAVRNGAAPALLSSSSPPGGRQRSRCHGGQSRAVPGCGTPLGLPCPPCPGQEKADKHGGISGPEQPALGL